jgi:hypothetical protein
MTFSEASFITPDPDSGGGMKIRIGLPTALAATQSRANHGSTAR